ncbi:angio-associated migratory cell protein [Prorops nasuta]|uniref:angio-associated migratory cell protein n=1 Tax=Prorops nasuta TaxID=863751 RepID=UPI0034CD109F
MTHVKSQTTPEIDNAAFVFKGHEAGSIFCGSLSKNGVYAATGGEDDKAYMWNTATGEIVLNCIGHKDSVIFAEFNFDETYLATGDMSGIIQVWKLSDKSVAWEYSMGDITWMKWHMASNILFGGSVTGEVYVWQVPSGKCKILQGHGGRAEAATIFPNGNRIAIGYDDGTIKTIDLKTTAVISTILPDIGHSSVITALDCYLDNNLIISAAVDGKTILSIPHTGKIVSVLQDLNCCNEDTNIEEENECDLRNNWVEAVTFCKAQTFPAAATGTLIGNIYIWDIYKQRIRHDINQGSGITKLCWKGNSTLLFSAGLDGILRCYEARTGQCLQMFMGHLADILDCFISVDGKKVLTTSDDNTARIFEIDNL